MYTNISILCLLQVIYDLWSMIYVQSTFGPPVGNVLWNNIHIYTVHRYIKLFINFFFQIFSILCCIICFIMSSFSILGAAQTFILTCNYHPWLSNREHLMSAFTVDHRPIDKTGICVQRAVQLHCFTFLLFLHYMITCILINFTV